MCCGCMSEDDDDGGAGGDSDAGGGDASVLGLASSKLLDESDTEHGSLPMTHPPVGFTTGELLHHPGSVVKFW